MRIYIIVFCFLFTQFSFSQNNSPWFTQLMIRDLVYELSSDDYEGRQAGEKGGEKAGEYIFNYLNKIFKNRENVDI